MRGILLRLLQTCNSKFICTQWRRPGALTVCAAPLPTPPRDPSHGPPPLADSCLRSSGRAMTSWAGGAGGATSGRIAVAAEAATFTLWCLAFVSPRCVCGRVPCYGGVCEWWYSRVVSRVWCWENRATQSVTNEYIVSGWTLNHELHKNSRLATARPPLLSNTRQRPMATVT